MLTSAPAVHVQNELKLLNKIKAKLLPEGYDNVQILQDYSSTVANAFKNLRRISPLNAELVMQEDVFMKWETQRRSALMVLYGRTAVTRTDLSWLSPMIFYLVDRYRGSKQTVACHCCHDPVFMDRVTPAYAVISNIIYQLLEAHPSLLRDQTRYQRIYERISEPEWRATPPKTPFSLLGELLNEFTSAYILLDRIDRINGELYRFMEPLAQLIKNHKCKVKILVLACSTGYEIPEGKLGTDLMVNLEHELGQEGFFSLALNQK